MKKTAFILMIAAASAVRSQTVTLNVWMDGKTTAIPVSEIRSLAVRSASGVSGKTEFETAVRFFALTQNFPNPFNPCTSIRYTVPGAGTAWVLIFDAAGRTVRSFEFTHPSAGSGVLDWNGRDDAGRTVPSGIYICRVTFGGAVLSRRMVLIR
jgi:hypothetical protein